MPDISSLMDFFGELSDEHTEALAELIVGLDPLEVEDGKPKYTQPQRQVITDARQAYTDAGYTTD